MTVDEILARLSWFSEEKQRLLYAEQTMQGVATEIRGIEINFDQAPNDLGDFSVLADALTKTRSAVLDDRTGSMHEGAETLRQLATAISTTGKHYLQVEAANVNALKDINQAIESEGL